MNIAAQAFLAALVAGLVVGGAFSLLDLPSPAPGTLAGVMGVVGSVSGIYAGYLLLRLLLP